MALWALRQSQMISTSFLFFHIFKDFCYLMKEKRIRKYVMHEKRLRSLEKKSYHSKNIIKKIHFIKNLNLKKKL